MSSIEPFRIEIPQPDIDELRSRIATTRWPDALPDSGWDYGVNCEHLMGMAAHWANDYDWRSHEDRLNELPQFITEIDGQPIHFVHLRSPEPDATPLLLVHGWPSTVHDFVDIYGPLTDPAAHGGDPADAFHVVAPSLPGFAYSGRTTEKGWGTVRIANAFADLMRRLGYDRYAAQGGDWGSMICPEIGRVDTESLIGIHVNALASAATASDPAELEQLSDSDREKAQANQRWWYGRSGYATEMSTRPQTVAYGFNDSPVGLLAWNLEWFVDYDPMALIQSPIDHDAILTNVSAFWFTETAGSAARLYLEGTRDRAWGTRPERSGVPTAVANFAGDHAVRGLAELGNDVVRWTTYDRGGHFASLQAPDLLVTDIREFFRDLRTT